MLKCLFLLMFPVGLWADAETFRISIYNFPRNLQPQLQSSSTSYLFQNIFRSLLIYDNKKGLLPDLAEKCVRSSGNKILKCRLKKNLKWSNGEKLTASDFVKTYRSILDPKNKFLRPDLLFPLKNAKKIYQSQKKSDELGVKALSENELQFELEFPDAEFEYNLSVFYLAPTKGSYDFKEGNQFLTNGPYRIKSWEPGRDILLESNPYYSTNKKPLVEFVVVDEDTVALRLYEKGEMGMVRRLPTLLVSKYNKRPDFHAIPVLRFDYLGMRQDLDLEIRKKLATSLIYEEWQQLLFSKGLPGCMNNKCYKFQKPATEDSQKASASSLKFYYSLQGGDDHRRVAEWLQAQWQKNAGISIQVKGLENKTFLSELKSAPPDIFRKGLAPDRPTCAGILENFTSEHPENYLKLRRPEFDKLLEDLRRESNPKKKNSICSKAFDDLFNQYLVIPTGSYDLAMLISPKFSGWKFNELNQLDLRELKVSVTK